MTSGDSVETIRAAWLSSYAEQDPPLPRSSLGTTMAVVSEYCVAWFAWSGLPLLAIVWIGGPPVLSSAGDFFVAVLAAVALPPAISFTIEVAARWRFYRGARSRRHEVLFSDGGLREVAPEPRDLRPWSGLAMSWIVRHHIVLCAEPTHPPEDDDLTDPFNWWLVVPRRAVAEADWRTLCELVAARGPGVPSDDVGG